MNKARTIGRGEWVTFLGFFTWGLTMFSRTAFGYYLTELELTSTQAGVANFLTSFCLFWSALFFSRLAERKNCHVQVLVAELVVCAAAMVGMGLASSYWMVLVVKVLLGIGCGPVFSLLMIMTEQASAPERYAANAAMVANGEAVISTALGPVLIVWCLAALGFLGTNLAFGVSILLMALLWLGSKKMLTRPRARAATEAESPKVSIWALLKNRGILVCTVCTIFTLVATWCIYVYAPSLLLDTGKYSDRMMSLIMTAMGIFMIVWMLVMPVLARRFGNKRASLILSFLELVALLALALFPENWLCVALFVVLGGNGSVVVMLYMAIIPLEYVEDSQSGTAMALVNGSGELLGASVGPLIAGVISDWAGMKAGMLFAAASMAVVLLVTLLLKEVKSDTTT